MNDLGVIIILLVFGAIIAGVVLAGKSSGSAAWCNLCNRNVTPRKDFNWLVFIFLCGFFYIPLYLLKGRKCPICKGTNFGPARAHEMGVSAGGQQQIIITQPQAQPLPIEAYEGANEQAVPPPGTNSASYCPGCGVQIDGNPTFCVDCGQQL